MIRFVLLTVISMFLAGKSFAQTDLVLFDNDGDRIGSVVGVGTNETDMLMRSADGYLMQVQVSGSFLPTNLGSLFYRSDDCSGQAYTVVQNGNPATNKFLRGGQIYQIGTPVSNVFMKIEWTPTVEEFVDLSYLNVSLNTCGVPTDGLGHSFVPVNIIDPAQYGIGPIPNTSLYGFSPPFTKKIEAPNVMFCGDFESCPAE